MIGCQEDCYSCKLVLKSLVFMFWGDFKGSFPKTGFVCWISELRWPTMNVHSLTPAIRHTWADCNPVWQMRTLPRLLSMQAWFGLLNAAGLWVSLWKTLTLLFCLPLSRKSLGEHEGCLVIRSGTVSVCFFCPVCCRFGATLRNTTWENEGGRSFHFKLNNSTLTHHTA